MQIALVILKPLFLSLNLNLFLFIWQQEAVEPTIKRLDFKELHNSVCITQASQ